MSDSFAQVGRRYFDDIIPEGLLVLTTCLLVYTSAAPVVCKTSYNFDEVLLCSKNGSFIKWQCPLCPPGYGLSVECGRQYPLGTIIECVQCAKGRNFSDTNGISQCQQCTRCQENEVGSGSCEPDQDTTRCKCKPGYYRHHSASCKQCSWCCKDKTNEHEEECNVVQVPPEKQCSFTTEKSCAPSTTSVPASTPTIGPTSSNVTTNETVSPTTLDSPEVQTKSTDTNNLHGSVVLYVILGAVLVVLIAIIIAACILCNRQRSGNDSPQEASSASSAMELNSSALLLSGNEDMAEQPTKEDNDTILLRKKEPKSCGQGKLNHPKKPSENAALEGTSMSRTTQVEHNSAEKVPLLTSPGNHGKVEDAAPETSADTGNTDVPNTSPNKIQKDTDNSRQLQLTKEQKLDLPATELPIKIYSNVCTRLDTEHSFFKDYRMLGEELDLSKEEVRVLQKNQTDSILVKCKPNIRTLIEILKTLDLEYLIEDIEKWLKI